MKVLGINGSARKDGNTAILLNTVFEELQAAGIETELVEFAGKAIQPCKACWACGGKRSCVHRENDFAVLYVPQQRHRLQRHESVQLGRGRKLASGPAVSGRNVPGRYSGLANGINRALAKVHTF